MLGENLRNRSVPRVEYDHRAREARLRLERIERMLVERPATAGPRLFRLFRLLGVGLSGGGRGDRATGSPSSRRPCGIPISAPGIGHRPRRTEAPDTRSALRPDMGRRRAKVREKGVKPRHFPLCDARRAVGRLPAATGSPAYRVRVSTRTDDSARSWRDSATGSLGMPSEIA
jgi:hypothetical protein